MENNTSPTQTPTQEQVNKKIANIIENEFEKLTLPGATNEAEREAAL